MRRVKEICACDRCHKEINKDEICYTHYDYASYELCEECGKIFEEFYAKVQDIQKTYREIEQAYKFGKFIPREDEDVQND